MKVLVIAATEHELKMPDTGPLHNGKYYGTDAVIAGIGIASTTYYLTKSLLQTKYDAVIQAGIGGTFTNDLLLGDVVMIGADTFADSGIQENGSFKSLFGSALAGKNTFPFKDGWLVNSSKVFEKTSLKTVKGITINTITDDRIQIEQRKSIYNAEVESMEGAALHYVCLQLSIPFLQMRSISNVVGERSKAKWKMKEAIDNLNSELTKQLSALNSI